MHIHYSSWATNISQYLIEYVNGIIWLYEYVCWLKNSTTVNKNVVKITYMYVHNFWRLALRNV